MSKMPLRTLSSADISVEQPAPPQEFDQDGEVPPPPPRRQMAWRPTVEVAERLRKISHRQRRPLQDILDEAVALWLARGKK